MEWSGGFFGGECVREPSSACAHVPRLEARMTRIQYRGSALSEDMMPKRGIYGRRAVHKSDKQKGEQGTEKATNENKKRGGVEEGTKTAQSGWERDERNREQSPFKKGNGKQTHT